MLLTRRSASPWNGWFNYTWSRVTDREDGRDTPRSWDQTNNFGAGVTWTDGGWQATLAGTYHTGWPTTPLRLVVSESGVSEWVAGPRNAGRLGAFASVDLRVSRDFVLRHGTLNVFAEATNLTRPREPVLHRLQLQARLAPALSNSIGSTATGCRWCRTSACSGNTD